MLRWAPVLVEPAAAVLSVAVPSVLLLVVVLVFLRVLRCFPLLVWVVLWSVVLCWDED